MEIWAQLILVKLMEGSGDIVRISNKQLEFIGEIAEFRRKIQRFLAEKTTNSYGNFTPPTVLGDLQCIHEQLIQSQLKCSRRITIQIHDSGKHPNQLDNTLNTLLIPGGDTNTSTEINRRVQVINRGWVAITDQPTYCCAVCIIKAFSDSTFRPN